MYKNTNEIVLNDMFHIDSMSLYEDLVINKKRKHIKHIIVISHK